MMDMEELQDRAFTNVLTDDMDHRQSTVQPTVWAYNTILDITVSARVCY
jgi:hypothetical protein